MTSPKVAFCQCSFDRDWERTVECVDRMHEGVDYVLIVTDKTVSEEDLDSLEEQYENVKIRMVEFPESLPEFRNNYLKMAEEHGVDWICVSDPDELFNEQFSEDVKDIVEELEEKGHDVAGINSHDKFEVYGEKKMWDELDELKEYPGEKQSDFFKNLLIKLKSGLRYVGVGKGDVHETWNKSFENPINLDEEKYWYVHEKTALDVWRNAARNVVLGGGGNNVKDLNPYYEDIHELMDSYNIESWQHFEGLITGDSGVEFPALKNHVDEWVGFFKRCLDAPNNDWGRETRQLAKFFFAHNQERVDEEVVSKIENPPERTERQKVRDEVRKLYFQLLGRHPDEEGLENYVEEVLSGVSLDEVKTDIMGSEEYRRKEGMEEVDITNKLPINISLNLNEELLVSILKQTGVWNDKIERRVELAKYIEGQTGDIEKLYDRFFREKELGELELTDLIGD